MTRIVLGLWMNFADNQWDKLIRSMPDKMKAVIAAKQYSTMREYDMKIIKAGDVLT